MSEQAKQKSMTIIGRVCGIPNGGTSKAGRKYNRLPIQSIKDASIYTVMCFDALSDRLNDFKIDDQISISGRKDKLENVIYADAVASDVKRGVVYRSPSVQAEEDRLAREYLTKHGCVQVRMPVESGEVLRVWAHKDSCVEILPGVWQMKIDYLMDCPDIGPLGLTKIMREMGGGSLAVKKDTAKKILAKIDEMILERTGF